MTVSTSAVERAAAREKRRKLFEKDTAEWTDEEVIEMLTERYAPTVIPPCRVCGAELSMQSMGGGPTGWACDGREEDPERPGCTRYTAGRTMGDEHYSRSRFEDGRCGGDEVVVELVRRFALVRNLTKLIGVLEGPGG